MDEIVEGGIDIYKELDVSPRASALEISKAFRKKALQFHPDKNQSPEAAEKFQLFSVINDILQDADLRAQYDNLRNRPAVSKDANWHQQANEFKHKLQRAEMALKREKSARNSATEADVAKLEMKGLKLRYVFQLKQKQAKEYVSFRDLPQRVDEQTITGFSASATVEVKWKEKAKDALISDSVLSGIMSIFGPVTASHIGSGDGRYAGGTVTFQHAKDAARAASHNYKESAALWDGTKYRKLASLLRGCTVVSGSDPRVDAALQQYIDRAV